MKVMLTFHKYCWVPLKQWIWGSVISDSSKTIVESIRKGSSKNSVSKVCPIQTMHILNIIALTLPALWLRQVHYHTNPDSLIPTNTWQWNMERSQSIGGMFWNSQNPSFLWCYQYILRSPHTLSWNFILLLSKL